MKRLFLLILLATLTPALADDPPVPNLMFSGRGTQGGVARAFLSRQLYALGQANKDALTVLNAARLTASVTLLDTPRAHETSGNSALITAPDPITAAQMFDTAAALATANDALLDLVDASRREASFAPLTAAVSSTSSLEGGQTDTWQVPFFGASLAELAILGDGASNLDLKIMDENANPVCQDIGPSDTAYCSFYPTRNGMFLITVINTGSGANTYVLLTN